MNLETGLPSYPDNFFDLAIVDPPYGIGIMKQFESANKVGTNSMFKQTKGIVKKCWDDKIPDAEYFAELKRVSKNQIIWGGNYFLDHLNNTKCVLIWDKMNGGNNMADAELAWTSFETAVRMFRMHHFSRGYGEKIHLAQKPVKLYQWILKNYALEGDKILDTHLGSGSSRIAAHKMGFDFYGFEIDPDYFSESEKRFKESISMPIFDKQIATQNELF